MRVTVRLFWMSLVLWSAVSEKSFAYGGYADFSGAFMTGGYSFSDIYNTNQYLSSNYGSWYGNSYSSPCTSLTSSCSGGYDYAGLYGNQWGYGSSSSYGLGYDLDISLDLIYALPQMNYWQQQPSCSSCDIGCSIGYCQMPTHTSCNNNSWPYPIQPDPYFPGTPTYEDPTRYRIPRPPMTPPWGGCDDVFVPCPRGPITRTPPTPVPPYQPPYQPQPPVGNPNPPVIPPTTQPPTYPQPQPAPSNGDPIRYRVPRGAHTI